jgi:hypothetical protein
VPSAPPIPTASCTHDLGYGTTVCLRCRQEQRDAVRSRQQRIFALSGICAMGLLGVYVMGASAANAWRSTKRGDTVHVASRASVVASSVSDAGTVKQQGTAILVSSAPPTAQLATSPAIVPASAPSPASATGSPLAIRVREGRSDLPDSLIAERAGDSVVVDFDTPMTRTRRRDKFEGIVRRTLPMVFGAPIDSVLRTIPDGGIVGSTDLLTELPKRGVHLPVAQGWTLDLWPETRPGQDGPLVVSYWARVTRDGALR